MSVRNRHHQFLALNQGQARYSVAVGPFFSKVVGFPQNGDCVPYVLHFAWYVEYIWMDTYIHVYICLRTCIHRCFHIYIQYTHLLFFCLYMLWIYFNIKCWYRSYEVAMMFCDHPEIPSIMGSIYAMLGRPYWYPFTPKNDKRCDSYFIMDHLQVCLTVAVLLLNWDRSLQYHNIYGHYFAIHSYGSM